MSDDFTLTLPNPLDDWDNLDTNVDVFIDLEDGPRYVATFFTLKNVADLMQTWKSTGEAASGRYF